MTIPNPCCGLWLEGLRIRRCWVKFFLKDLEGFALQVSCPTMSRRLVSIESKGSKLSLDVGHLQTLGVADPCVLPLQYSQQSDGSGCGAGHAGSMDKASLSLTRDRDCLLWVAGRQA